MQCSALAKGLCDGCQSYNLVRAPCAVLEWPALVHFVESVLCKQKCWILAVVDSHWTNIIVQSKDEVSRNTAKPHETVLSIELTRISR